MSIRRRTLLLTLSLATALFGQNAKAIELSNFHLPHIDLTAIGIGEKRVVLKGHLDKIALSETPVQLWADTSLGSDCTPAGETRLEVVTPAAHGSVLIRDGELYAVYPEGHPRAYCSGRLVTGVLAVYTAEKGYAGPDQVVLRGVTADGETRLVTVDITVHARAPGPLKPRPAGMRPTPAKPIQAQPSSSTPGPPPLDPVPPPTVRHPSDPAPEVLSTPFPKG